MLTEKPNLVVLQTEPSIRQQSVVLMLEKALAEADAGEISSIGLAIVRPDGSTCTRRARTDNIAILTGAVAFLLNHLVWEANGRE